MKKPREREKVWKWVNEEVGRIWEDLGEKKKHDQNILDEKLFFQ